MAPEASWQASSAKNEAGGDDPRANQDSVESLLRRLIQRVEESERRYDEALEELHARLDRLSQTPEAPEAAGSAEETETLEQLRNQLSRLARRLEQPQEPLTEIEELTPLDRALAEVRAVSAGLAAAEPGLFGSQPPAAGDLLAGIESAFSFPAPQGEPRHSAPPFEPPAFASEEADLDRRLMDMAQQLEQAIGKAMPATAIETLNGRMDEIAARFEAALRETPKLENLQQLQRQITAMGQQLGRAEQHIARIAAIENQLQRLISRLDDTPAQMERLASTAANEAARLAVDTGLGKPSAAERLDAIHRDIVAMNERSRATDDRLVDTVAAMHESVKGLMQQAERPATPAPQGAPPPPGERDQVGLAAPRPPGNVGTDKVEDHGALAHDDSEAAREGKQSLRHRLSAAASTSEGAGRAGPFGRAKRSTFAEEAVDFDEVEPSPRSSVFVRDTSFDSTEHLVDAARRAAQAAAARAEERRTSRPWKALAGDETLMPVRPEPPERRKRSILMVIAALLLMVSAALLYSRLKSKPELEVAPPATEQTAPAPATGLAPVPEPPAAAGVAPTLDGAAPDTVPAAEAPVLESEPEAGSVPEVAPGIPHATTPSAKSGDWELPPPVRISDAPTAIASAADFAIPTGGVTEIAKSAPAKRHSHVRPRPQPVSLTWNEGEALPPGVGITVAELSAAGSPPMPADELGTPALRQAAASGDPRAQYAVALRYAEGRGSARAAAPNWTEAARWFALAASAGLAPAQFRLAVLYQRGDGVAKDLGRARSWYARAAEQGNVKAMHNLAVAASRGQGGGPDYAFAAKWYAEAASYGLADSQFNLGVLATHGLGIEQNLAEAFKWFSLAAAAGDEEAIEQRDLTKAKLRPAEVAAAERAVRTWKAKPLKPEANEVPELD